MKRGMRLKTLSDIRRFAAKVANMLYKDEMPEGKARALAYIAATLKDIVKETKQEERLSAVEEALKRIKERRS